MFSDQNGPVGRTVSSCKILSKSLVPRPRYGDFSIFQDGGRRHLVFLKFQIFTVRTVKKVKLHHCTKFRQNRSYRGRDMAIFGFFKMAAAVILDFRNFKFLTFELHHRAKFRQNSSNHGQNMAIFRFFKMADTFILDFRNFELLMVGTVKRVKLRHRAKFRWNLSNRGRDMTIFQFNGRTVRCPMAIFQDGGRHLEF